MSADNGIYILKTRGPEFRVAHLQAIDNLDWGRNGCTDDPDVRIANAREMWFGSPVFKTEEEAWEEARRLHSLIEYTEYGVSMVEIDRVFTHPQFKIEAYNPVDEFETLRKAVEFVKQEDNEADSISFCLSNGERVELSLDNGKIVLDEFEMGY